VLRTESQGARGWYQILADPALATVSDTILDGCLNCKSCRATCPAGVDVSRAILDARARRGGDPLSEKLFKALLDGSLDGIVPLLGKTQSLWDRPLARKAIERLTRPLMKRIASTARIPAASAFPDSPREPFGTVTAP
jgi:hypothetical protein